MALDPLLLEVLACPEDKGPLLVFADEDLLYNPRLHRAYAIRDGIPVMLLDEARQVDDAEHQRLLARAERDQIPSTLSSTPPASGPPASTPPPSDPPASTRESSGAPDEGRA